MGRYDTLIAPLRRIELAIPLFLFALGGVITAWLILPETWPAPARVLAGIGVGVLSWMFPYLNRVLED